MKRLAIVCPCYNEEDVLESSIMKLHAVLNSLLDKNKIDLNSFILLVNDGSKDRTWEIIKELHQKYKFIKGIDLAHNVGHQSAILAGMMSAKEYADMVITIDVDLQDDLEAIEKMVDAYSEGYDVVYGVKVSRTADPVLKRMTAVAFYKLQKAFGIESIYNHADFRLLSKRTIEMLANYGERNLYLRGIIPMIGMPSTTVDDVISDRSAGKSKYTLSKMLNLALDGITSFSSKPIYLILYLGILFLIVAVLICLDIVLSLINGSAVPGWASIMVSLWFIGGACLVSMGTLGIYIGKMYIEVKHRPLYNIKEFLD